MADAEITRRVVTTFWAAMQANDWAAAAALFADDYVLLWPQSGEPIRGVANFVAINRAYPAAGRWRFAVERLVVALLSFVLCRRRLAGSYCFLLLPMIHLPEHCVGRQCALGVRQ